jgi:hypothetical protein
MASTFAKASTPISLSAFCIFGLNSPMSANPEQPGRGFGKAERTMAQARRVSQP